MRSSSLVPFSRIYLRYYHHHHRRRRRRRRRRCRRRDHHQQQQRHHHQSSPSRLAPIRPPFLILFHNSTSELLRAKQVCFASNSIRVDKW